MRKFKDFIKSVKTLTSHNHKLSELDEEYKEITYKRQAMKRENAALKENVFDILGPGFLKSIRTEFKWTARNFINHGFEGPRRPSTQHLCNIEHTRQNPTIAILQAYAALAAGEFKGIDVSEVDEQEETKGFKRPMPKIRK